MNRKIILTLVAFCLAACSKAPDYETSNTDAPISMAHKIINQESDAAQGSLIVCFNDDAISTIEQSTVRTRTANAVVTRSGLTSFDKVFSTIRPVSFERVFTYNPKTESRMRQAGLHKWYVVYFDSREDLSQAAIKFAAIHDVQHVQFNTCMQKASDCKVVPFSKAGIAATKIAASADKAPFNDPLLPYQWHYINNGSKDFAPTCRQGADINAGEAWKITAGDPQVIVAIVDEGVKYTHPDLKANMWTNQAELNGTPGVDDDGNGYVDDVYGHNFATGGPISWTFPLPDNKGDSGHGTHVAGTVAAVNNNGIGVSGVAGGFNNGGVRLMSCQVLSGEDKDQSGTAVVIARAIQYAADMGASIIQASIGFKAGYKTSDLQFQDHAAVEIAAINYFISISNCKAIEGGLVIFAAGNETTDMSSYPGAYRKVISVTSFSPDYLPAYYTNYGPGCNIAAPGGDVYISDPGTSSVLSTLPSELNQGEDYGYMQGTSMACPHVSGVAALGLSYALSKGKHFSNSEFKSMILTSVNDIDSYLVGTKQSKFLMNLANYRLKMGSGAIDAYQLLLQIEGTPCLKAKVNASQALSLTKYFGGGASTLTYTNVEVSAEDMTKLGITDKPSIREGKLLFKCTKAGVLKIKVTAIAGGDSAGTESSMGGMYVTKEVVIIAREIQTANGGWL